MVVQSVVKTPPLTAMLATVSEQTFVVQSIGGQIPESVISPDNHQM